MAPVYVTVLHDGVLTRGERVVYDGVLHHGAAASHEQAPCDAGSSHAGTPYGVGLPSAVSVIHGVVRWDGSPWVA